MNERYKTRLEQFFSIWAKQPVDAGDLISKVETEWLLKNGYVERKKDEKYWMTAKGERIIINSLERNIWEGLEETSE